MWNSFDSKEKKFISYEGALPTHLYRYRSITPKNLDRVIDFEILEEAVYLAALKDLNDPDEGRFLIKFNNDDDAILKYWQKVLRMTNPSLSAAHIDALAKDWLQEIVASGYVPPERVVSHTRSVLEHVLRVACFTTQPVNYSMWANYARHVDIEGNALDHGGICIEYRCDEGWRSSTLHPVAYSDDVPVVDPAEQDERKLIAALYAKAREWRGEEEWRVAYVLQTMSPFSPDLEVNSKIQFAGAVKSIIFGLQTPPDLIKKIRTRVSAQRPEISYKQVVRNPLTYVRELSVLPDAN